MATPHVSGLVAYLYGLDSTLSPDEVETTIKAQALKGVISGVREYIIHPHVDPSIPGTEAHFSLSAEGTANLLVNNAS